MTTRDLETKIPATGAPHKFIPRPPQKEPREINNDKQKTTTIDLPSQPAQLHWEKGGFQPQKAKNMQHNPNLDKSWHPQPSVPKESTINQTRALFFSRRI